MTTGRKRAGSLVLVLVTLLGASLSACGGDEPEQPTTVSAADLQKDGNFWAGLTPDLKDELVEMAKTRLGEVRPDGATGIEAAPTDELVAEIEKEYSNESKRTATIYSTYTSANDRLAGAEFDDAIDQLNQLCSSEPRPPECDE